MTFKHLINNMSCKANLEQFVLGGVGKLLLEGVLQNLGDEAHPVAVIGQQTW